LPHRKQACELRILDLTIVDTDILTGMKIKSVDVKNMVLAVWLTGTNIPEELDVPIFGAEA
jgi:hypothetical protein